MQDPFAPGDRTPEGLLTPEAYRRWFEARCRQSPPRRCALVLAGGRSRRMGADKASVTLEGETLLERAVRFWQGSGLVDQVLVSLGAEDGAHPLPAGAVPVVDPYPDRGPMAGLAAAFEADSAQLLYVSAVDMPFLTREAILPEPPGDAAVYRLQGRPEPLFGVYRRSVLPLAQELLAQGTGRMVELLARADTLYWDAAPALAPLFSNLNTPQALNRARAGQPPMVAVTGWSGVGKTTFLEGLLPELKRRGLRVAVIKHDAHGFQMDTPGTDTHRLSQAGADPVGILGPQRWALLGTERPSLQALRRSLPPVDLILAEGFKYSSLPKLEVRRSAAPGPRITRDDTLLALVTDEAAEAEVPCLGLNDFSGCADLLQQALGLSSTTVTESPGEA